MITQARVGVVHVDSRGRISLGRFGVEPGQWFRAYSSDSGVVRLVPVKFPEDEENHAEERD